MAFTSSTFPEFGVAPPTTTTKLFDKPLSFGGSNSSNRSSTFFGSAPASASPRTSVASTTARRSPFDSAIDGVVILHTSDNVKFHVHKGVLSLASRVFARRFSVPQPLFDSPAVNVPETSKVWEPILRLCYPVDKPDLSDITTVTKILAVAQNYEMASIISQLDPVLVGFIPSAPKQAFALACHHKIERVARGAATQLSFNNGPIQITPDTKWEDTLPGKIYVEEMAHISAGAYSRLLKFLNETSSTVRFHPTSYFKGPSSFAVYPPGYSDDGPPQGPPWFLIPSSTDIVVYAVDGKEFPVHRFILTAASEEFRRLLSSEDTTCLRLSDVGDTLAIILRSCYPGGGTLDAKTSLSRTACILEAAVRYKLPILVESAKRRMAEFVKSNPLELYLRAVTVGWKDAARAAAVQLTRHPLSTLYHPQLEDVPAVYYQALLKFDFEYKKAHVQSLSNLVASQQTSILDGNCWVGVDLNNVSGETTPDSLVNFINLCTRRSCSESLSDALTYYSLCAKRSKRALSRIQLELPADHTWSSI